MPFTNPIVAGRKLVRQAIESPDYSPGLSGWAINRDGTAEFNNVTVRGELLVEGTDGSSAHVYNDPAYGAVVELTPQFSTTYGSATAPSRIRSGADNTSSPPSPGTLIEGPAFGSDAAYLFLGRDSTGSYAYLNGVRHALIAAADYLSLYAPIIRLLGNAEDINGNRMMSGKGSGRIDWQTPVVSTDPNGFATVSHNLGTVPSAVTISQNGNSTGTSPVHAFYVNGSATATTIQVKVYNAAGSAVLASSSVGLTVVCYA